MDFDELKRKSNLKVLVRGKSSYGKTYNGVIVSLELGSKGYDVLYVDTEAEGATTMVKLVEREEYSEEDVESIDYEQVSEYDGLVSAIRHERQRRYDLVVVDTLDHKHTFSIRKVMEDVIDDEEEDGEMDPDWNMYPEIYAREKDIMETLGKAKTNLLVTLDPDSGKMDKPKGTQTNVHGYFTGVIDLKEDGGEYLGLVRNWVGSEKDSTVKTTNVHGLLTKKFEQRIE